jgi:tetratricopeptide (TPR) repeat protein
MKSLIILFFLLAFPAFILGQAAPAGSTPAQLTPTQNSALAEAKKLNLQLVDLYQEQKYGDALKLAAQIQDLIDRNGLGEDPDALTMLSNVGEVLLAKGKESDAVSLFQRVLNTYRKTLGDGSRPEAETTERITRAYFAKGDYKTAETYCLLLFPLYTKLDGAASKKISSITTFLGNIYRFRDRLELADETYLKAIALNDRIMTTDEKLDRTDVDKYRCFLFEWGVTLKRPSFATEKVSKFLATRPEQWDSGKDRVVVDGGELNGKALVMVRPALSFGAVRRPGIVIVHVRIDEKGNVIKAKSICGVASYFEASEAAAMAAKFTPTVLSGKPAQVTGTITYNFVN